jgi:hypothetical protein
VQHAQIEELFQLVETSKGKDKQAAFEELVLLLEVHEAAEAQLVHPLAAQDPDSGAEVINARLEEEDEAKDLLAGLIETGTTRQSFDADFQALRTAVLEHASNAMNSDGSRPLTRRSSCKTWPTRYGSSRPPRRRADLTAGPPGRAGGPCCLSGVGFGPFEHASLRI